MDTEELKQHIKTYFGDTSRSPEETLEGLEEAAGEIDMLMDAIKADLNKG